jgi:hypothetical protein
MGAFQVRCYVCDGEMKEMPNKRDASLHFFECPYHCPGSQRIICEDNTTQEQIDEEYRVHLEYKNRQ